MLRFACFACAAACAVVIGAGCSTAPRDIETPTGPVPGDLTGPFEVLGIASRMTTTRNRATSPETFTEFVDLDVPFGTEAIVPCVRGVMLVYGEVQPDDPGFTGNQTILCNERPLGFEFVNVGVDRVFAPDPSTHTQKARLQVCLMLRDRNGDDKSYVSVRYTLLFLGHSGAGRG